MEGVRQDTPAARYVAQNLKHEAFVLVDVGCSGGLDNGWRSFGDRLQAVGFDPSFREVERLNRAEINPLVKYYAGFVGVPPDHPRRAQMDAQDLWGRNISSNLSCYKTFQMRQQPQYEQSEWVASEARAADQEIADPSRPISLPEFLEHQGLKSVDFIKIDVDGADYIILQSLRDVFDDVQALGVGVEVNYFGSERDTDNVFHNVDRLMRSKSFGLFDLSVRHYSSATLPWAYALPHPYAAQSVRGRPYQGDALYMRDSAVEETGKAITGYSAEKLAKLVAIFAVFNLPDQAAEICDRFRGDLASVLDVDYLLDLLALQIQEAQGGQLSYAQYMAAFNNDDPIFYGAGIELRLNQQNAEIKQLSHDLAVAQREAAQFKDDFQGAWAWIASLKADLQATQEESANHNHQFEERTKDLDSARREFDLATEQIGSLMAKLQDVEGGASVLAGANDDLTRRLAAADEALNDANMSLQQVGRELTAVLQSRAWRMTRGVSSLAARLRGNSSRG